MVKHYSKQDLRDIKQQLSAYLEDFHSFRDYRFMRAAKFGKTSIKASINLLQPDFRELDDALNVFCRDGYSTIIIYL